MTIKAIAAYQPTKTVPDRQDIVRMQQQPTQAINELLARVAALEKTDPWHFVGTDGEPAFENGWVNHGGASEPDVAFCLVDSRFVFFDGIAKSGTITAAMFTLPTGYRPSTYCYLPVCSFHAFAEVIIYPDGRVIPQVGNNSWFALNGVFFEVA